MGRRRNRLKGAAVLAALMLAGTAMAQGSGDDPLSGDLDFEPPLGPLGLYSESTEGFSSYSGSESTARLRQVGTGNTAEIRQTSSSNGALAVMAQYGSGNTISVDQCACGNLADILQEGTGNVSGITQSGAGNVFIHRQYGDGLGLSVTQYGGAQIAITQSGP